MRLRVKQVAVIGSGIMGARIAALFANVGIRVKLFDIVPNDLKLNEHRSKLAIEAKKNLLKQKPNSFTRNSHAELVEPCNLEDDVEQLRSCDWIIEAIIENLAIKQQLLAQIEPHCSEHSVISSNTSGISIATMVHDLPLAFRKRFLGTHFFNPPRYMKLLEIIPTKHTDHRVIEQVKQFSEEVLGKGIVNAKDTPNFIANRIGTYGLLVTVQEMMAKGLTVGEVDSLTGTLIGRPKSATFRTLDVVGLDTMAHVTSNMFQSLQGEDKDTFVFPTFMKEMLQGRLLGSKTGKGFYRKQESIIQELNWRTMQYGLKTSCKADSIVKSKQAKTFEEKLQTLVFSNDRAGTFLWSVLSAVLLYSAQLQGEISDDIVAIDQAMKWGFGWDHGPFELWDALGFEQTLSKLKYEGRSVPLWIEQMAEAGHSRFYQDNCYYKESTYHPLLKNEKVIDIHQLKKTNKVIKQNSSATLLEFGDGIALLEIHSPNNAIGADLMKMINFAITEVERHYDGLVIASQGNNFCVGANLAMILLEAQDDNLFEIDLTIRQFQQVTMNIKYATKPVVIAPYKMTLGGGAELCLPAARIQATTETYMGLVEVGVGLIPGGGGCKELYLKHLQSIPEGVQVDLQAVANKVFETIALAKTSTSADEALENQFLQAKDGISRNADFQLYDAKQTALFLARTNYLPPHPRRFPVVGESGFANLVMYAESMRSSGYISDHDLYLAKKLAYVISGGNVPFGTIVDEQYLLDLEREVFLELVRHPKTQERMAHMLATRKLLRN